MINIANTTEKRIKPSFKPIQNKANSLVVMNDKIAVSSESGLLIQ